MGAGKKGKNSHGKSSGSLNRICCVIVPDPFFSRPHTKEKKAVWLRETRERYVHNLKFLSHSWLNHRNQASNGEKQVEPIFRMNNIMNARKILPKKVGISFKHECSLKILARVLYYKGGYHAKKFAIDTILN